MNRPDEHISVEGLLPPRSTTLVTEIVSYDPDRGITCGLELSGDEDYFQGHFPDAPVFPGVLEMEAMYQAACLWYALKAQAKNAPRRKGAPCLVLAGIRSARFQHTIIPPRSVEITARIEHRTDDEMLFSGAITERDDENPKEYATASFLTALSG
jgi:3-hydroxyacyl-[acyl-carrier-protein] dehydratase